MQNQIKNLDILHMSITKKKEKKKRISKNLLCYLVESL